MFFQWWCYRLKPAGCRVKPAASLVWVKGAVTLTALSSLLQMLKLELPSWLEKSNMNRVISIVNKFSNPACSCCIPLSYIPWVTRSACWWCSAGFHKWQWPKLGPEWPEPSPLVAFPDCVSTHRSDYSTFSFCRFDGTGKLPRLVGAYQTYHLLPWVSQCAPRLSGISSILDLVFITQPFLFKQHFVPRFLNSDSIKLDIYGKVGKLTIVIFSPKYKVAPHGWLKTRLSCESHGNCIWKILSLFLRALSSVYK